MCCTDGASAFRLALHSFFSAAQNCIRVRFGDEGRAVGSVSRRYGQSASTTRTGTSTPWLGGLGSAVSGGVRGVPTHQRRCLHSLGMATIGFWDMSTITGLEGPGLHRRRHQQHEALDVMKLLVPSRKARVVWKSRHARRTHPYPILCEQSPSEVCLAQSRATTMLTAPRLDGARSSPVEVRGGGACRMTDRALCALREGRSRPVRWCTTDGLHKARDSPTAGVDAGQRSYSGANPGRWTSKLQ